MHLHNHLNQKVLIYSLVEESISDFYILTESIRQLNHYQPSSTDLGTTDDREKFDFFYKKAMRS